MRSHLLTLLTLVLTLSATAAHADGASPPVFAEADVAALEAATSELARQFEGALSGDPAAREALLKTATSRTRVSTQLTRVMDAAAILGPKVKATITGLEVRGSLWWGLSPIWDLEIFYWLAGERPSILRMTHTPSRRDLFGATPTPAPGATLLGAISAMSDALVKAIGEGRCDALPVVTPDDYVRALPREARAKNKTTTHLDRFRHQVRRRCGRMSAVPAHRTTWSLGEAAVVLAGTDGRRMSLRIQFSRGRAGRFTIRRITTPVAPTPQAN